MAPAKRAPKQIGSAPTAETEERPTPPASLMTALNEYIQSDDAKKPDTAYIVPGRPAISLIFDLNIEYDVWERWTSSVIKKKKGEAQANYLALAHIVISNQNIGMTFNGKKSVSETDDEDMTVKHPDLHQMLNVPIGSVKMAIRALFGNDADVLAMLRRIAADAGYSLDGDAIEEDSPLDD